MTKMILLFQIRLGFRIFTLYLCERRLNLLQCIFVFDGARAICILLGAVMLHTFTGVLDLREAERGG